jgi:hypothetical protein
MRLLRLAAKRRETLRRQNEAVAQQNEKFLIGQSTKFLLTALRLKVEYLKQPDSYDFGPTFAREHLASDTIFMSAKRPCADG